MATKYRILIGCSVKQEPHVLQYYLKSLKALHVPQGTELSFAFVNDGDKEQADILLSSGLDAELLPATPRPPDAVYGVGPKTHHWQVSTFEHLALQKQRLIEYAIENHYTHILFVDSDLLLEPTTLVSLWYTKGDLVNGVFWTSWDINSPLQPQCWLTHPYALAGLGMEEHEYVRGLTNRQLIRVLGGGACTLVATEALQRGVRYHPRLPLPQEGMWQGEDRTFAITAQRLHERQLADGWPDIYHAYHPHQRTPEALEEAWTVLSAPRQERATYGDLISIIIDPLEDLHLLDENRLSSILNAPEVRCFRGRLGALPLAPELEAEILTMKAGDTNMVEISFPPWHEIREYRNTKKVVKLHLVDVKPYGFAPMICDVAFVGVGNGN